MASSMTKMALERIAANQKIEVSNIKDEVQPHLSEEQNISSLIEENNKIDNQDKLEENIVLEQNDNIASSKKNDNKKIKINKSESSSKKKSKEKRKI